MKIITKRLKVSEEKRNAVHVARGCPPPGPSPINSIAFCRNVIDNIRIYLALKKPFKKQHIFSHTKTDLFLLVLHHRQY